MGTQSSISNSGGINIAGLISSLAPIFLGSGKTTTSTSTSGTAEEDLNNTIAQATSNSTNPDITNGIVNNIMTQAAINFAPVAGQQGGAGLYNSSTLSMLSSMAQGQATAQSAAAVLNYQTQQQQIAEQAAGTLANANKVTVAQTAPSVSSSSLLETIAGGAATSALKSAFLSTGSANGANGGDGGIMNTLFGSRNAASPQAPVVQGGSGVPGTGTTTTVPAGGNDAESGIQASTGDGFDDVANPVTTAAGNGDSDILSGALGDTSGPFGPSAGAATGAGATATNVSAPASISSVVGDASGDASGISSGIASDIGSDTADTTASLGTSASDVLSSSAVDTTGGGLTTAVDTGISDAASSSVGATASDFASDLGSQSAGDIADITASAGGDIAASAVSDAAASAAAAAASDATAAALADGLASSVAGLAGGVSAVGGLIHLAGTEVGGDEGTAISSVGDLLSPINGVADVGAAIGDGVGGTAGEAITDVTDPIGSIGAAISVVCTVIHSQGKMNRRFYLAGMHRFNNYSQEARDGYYLWAAPLACYVKNSPTTSFSKIAIGIFNARAENIAAADKIPEARRKVSGYLARALIAAVTVACGLYVLAKKFLVTKGILSHG